MPRLIAFYIRHVLIGFALSAAFVGLLLWLNIANLWHLISTSDVGVLAVFLLFLFNGIVFSGVQFGIAIMALGQSDRAGRGPGRSARPGLSSDPATLQAIHLPLGQGQDGCR